MDMDGTLYLSESLLPGAKDLVDYFQKQGIPFCLFTNNSSFSRMAYVTKLGKMGIVVDKEQILTSAYATILWLQSEGISSIYLMSVPEVTEEFLQAGFRLDSTKPEAVVLTFDKTLTYEKLCIAHRLLLDTRIRFVSSHPDLVCPMADASIPDAGAMMALLKASTGRDPIVIGKPESGMVKMAESYLGCDASRMAIVGDRLYTDMRMGKNHGLTTVLLFSGETTRDTAGIQEISPDHCFDNALELYQKLCSGGLY